MTRSGGFSLVEILVIVAVIAVLTTLIVASISGVSERSYEVAARQQQAELQSALGAWIVSATADSNGLAGARQRYNDAANKLSLLSNYLQAETFLRLSNTGTAVNSAALSASQATLRFSALWSAGSVPTVTWSNN